VAASSSPLFAQTCRQLERIASAPICTVYLQYPEHIAAEQAMTGLTGTLGQWLFDRRLCRQSGLMAVVISGHGEHEQMDNDELGLRISQELARLYPHWPQPQQVFVIREKRATFVCERGINRSRPHGQTAAHNVWLAGDYTATGYPATLEGAVRSGLHCARLIINSATPSPGHQPS